MTISAEEKANRTAKVLAIVAALDHDARGANIDPLTAAYVLALLKQSTSWWQAFCFARMIKTPSQQTLLELFSHLQDRLTDAEQRNLLEVYNAAERKRKKRRS